jgi:hypothetical protein
MDIGIENLLKQTTGKLSYHKEAARGIQRTRGKLGDRWVGRRFVVTIGR